MDLSLGLGNTHVLITGGSGFIGSATVTAFLSAGALVTSLDLKPPSSGASSKFRHVSCDITSESELEEAFIAASKEFGPVACCVALAGLDLSFIQHHQSLTSMSVEQWRRTHRVNVEGTFLTARTWLRGIKSYQEPRGWSPRIKLA